MEILGVMPFHLTTDMTVKQLLEHYPQALREFIKLKLLCVGCPTEAFHTLADVAREYGLDQEEFIAGLQTAVDQAKKINTDL